jgi:hypothetical protein
VREYISSDSIAATVRMLRSTFSGSFFLVEGEVDVRLLRRFVDQSVCQIQICHNRSNVIRVVAILDADHFAGHLGIVDRDFGHILNEQLKSENLIVTAENDIELVIFQSEAFERFIAEYANADKVAALEAAMQRSLREVLICSASTIGTLRYLSKLRRWNLDFEGMTIRYVDRREMDIDLDLEIEHLRGRSYPTTMPIVQSVREEFDCARRQFPDLLSHTHGHDLCEIVSKGIHEVFGRANVALGRGGAAVEEVLRAAFSVENFRASPLFAGICAWERNHRPFRILP